MLAMMARLASEAGIPRIIVHSHCTGKAGLKHSASKAITAGALSRYPSAYCSCSREAGEWRFPRRICRSSLNIINNGIDVERFRYDENVRKEMRSRLGLDDDTVLVGCVGRLTYQKNQSFLLDVMREAAELDPDKDCRLILIGDGEDRSVLEKKAADLDIQNKVIFTGAVSNVKDYLQALDVAVMPSRYEGLAIAVIEAQAAGLDVIASDAIPELAAVTENVSFIPLNEMDAWEEAITAVHERHPDAAQCVVKNGFGIKDAADAVRNLYQK
jgi:glycosyltransferase involved in cell wall biosynthesis